MPDDLLEQTAPQVLLAPAISGELIKEADVSSWAKKVRAMRRDPTLALARDLVVAPILAADWSYEMTSDATDEMKELIEEQMNPLKFNLMNHMMRGWLDFGWQPFEKVFAAEDGQIKLKKLKPLIQDYSEILVDGHGCIEGLKQTFVIDGSADVLLDITEVLITYTGVEGTDWYGEPIMRAAEIPYDAWLSNCESADRYDRKIAGSHWVLYYPTGETTFQGTLTDNLEIARAILRSLESSGAIALPRDTDELLQQLGAGATDPRSSWHLELLTDGGAGQDGFIDKFKYLDSLKVRALRLPERSVLEGNFGTKAEAEAHADFAITIMEQRHLEATMLINWHCINQLLTFNFGPQAENYIKIVPAPLADATRAILIDLFTSVISNPDGFLNEFGTLDMEAIKEQIGIPTQDEDTELLLPSSEPEEALPAEDPSPEPEEEEDEE